MALKKDTKSPDQLILENNDLKNRLAIAENLLHGLSPTTEIAVAELRKSKKLLQSLLDNANSGVALIDETGRFAICNPLFLKLFGLSEDSSIKNVNDQKWAEWQVFSEQGNLLDVDDHPVRKAVITGKRIDQQLVGVRLPSGGEIIWMLISAEPIFKDNGDIENVICTYTDITSRRKTEQSLVFQSQLISNVNDAVFSSDLTYRITFWNKAAERIFGWNEEEALGKNSGELLLPEIEGSTRNKERSKLRRQGHWEGETVYRRKDGTSFVAEVNSTVLKDEKGNDNGNVVIVRDISARKKIEIALHESEQRYHQMFDKHQAVGLLIEPETGEIIDANSSALKFYGYTYEQLCSLKIQNINQLPPEEVEAERKKALFEQRNYFVFPHRLANGEVKWVEVYSSPLNSNGRQQLYSIIHDITSRKQAEESLRISEARYRNLFSVMPSGVAVYEVINEGNDPDGKDFIFKDMNPAGEMIDNVIRAEIIGKSLYDFFPTVREIGLPSLFQRVWRTGVPEFFPVTLYTDNRVSLWVTNYVWKLPSGELVALFEDITERKIVEEKLRESESRFRNLVKNAPTAIFEVDIITWKLLSANDALCEFTGYSKEELLSINPIELLVEESKELLLSRISDINKGKIIEENVEYKVIAKDGHCLDAILNMKFNYNNDGIAVSATVVGHDITSSKKAERELLKITEVLKESEQRLKYHLENSPLAVVEWDKDFRIIQWSGEAAKMFGLEKEYVLGMRMDQLNIIFPDDIPIVENTSKRLLSGKELNVTSQNRNINKSGEVLECVWYNSVLLDENGEMSSVLSLVEDVTLLRKTERELISSQNNYKELVTNARSMILKFDNDANFTFINDYALEFFGYELDELLGKSVMIVVPKVESTGRDMDEMVENIVEDPDKYSVNINENIKKNGEKVWVEWHNKAIYNTLGEKTGHTSIGIDITKRKLAEENLKESEKKLKSVLNATLESIYMFDTKGIICMTNTTGMKRLKRNSEDEVIGHHYSEFMSPEIAQSRQQMQSEVIKTGKPQEYEDERDNRTYHHSFSPVVIDDKVQFIVTYSSDITERKNSELKLKQSEDRLRTIAESLTVMITITRKDDSVVLFANEPYLKAFELNHDDIIGKIYPDIFVNAEERSIINDLLRESEIISNREIKVKRSDGTEFWIITSIRKISYLGETSFLASSIDISETKRTQEELIRLNRTLNAHSKSSQAMMHSKDEFSYLNEVCKIIIEDCGHSMVWVGYAQNDEEKNVKPVAYYGFDKGYIDQMKVTWDDSVYGRGPTGTAIKTCRPSICKNMLTDPRFKPWREAAIARGFASSLVLPLILEGKSFGAVSIYSKEPDAFSDSEIDLLNNLVDDLAHGISYIRLEEYERAAAKALKENEVKLKDLIVTKDKFFNIVAHDLKNPFTSLLGSSELLYDNISEMTTDNVKKLALILNDSAKSGYAILQNLLDWSRSQTGMIRYCPTEINLRLIIEENIENLYLQTSNKEINMLSELKTDLIISADRNIINTVLRNLLSNAVKFTHKKGEIRIIAAHGKNEVIVSVIDSGIGMSKDRIDQLFRLENSLSLPGTEKEQGTGLGLKLCKEFTELMGGRIRVESVPGKGSRFSFSIPVKKDSRNERMRE